MKRVYQSINQSINQEETDGASSESQAGTGETEAATCEGNSEDMEDEEPMEVEEPPLPLQPQVIVLTRNIIFMVLGRIICLFVRLKLDCHRWTVEQTKGWINVLSCKA